jgi:hypothetical protein
MQQSDEARRPKKSGVPPTARQDPSAAEKKLRRGASQAGRDG